jgi:ribokinase
MPAKIVVVGSSNTDMVVRTERIPRGGETVLGGELAMVPGGKGANQAVCAAKLGADAFLVARIGRDVFAQLSVENFRLVGVRTDFVFTDPDAASGVALIVVDDNAENAIVVAPGANGRLAPADVDAARDVIAAADAVLLQFEAPMKTVLYTLELARSLGVRTVLNPAPMIPMPERIFELVDVLVLNQHEAALLLGWQGGDDLDARTAASNLLDRGVKLVAITLGADGALIATGGMTEHIDAVRVKPVDTTAAGDAFTAAFACGLAEGMSPVFAARFAAGVAAIVVTRIGAQPSMPSRDEVESV